MLSNLLSNAVKYTMRGRIEARVERRGDDRMAIAIADTGPGLSPEELTEAFEPFRRVARTAAGVPGAGLGLSLSRQPGGADGRQAGRRIRPSASAAASPSNCPIDTAALIDVREPTTPAGAPAPAGSLKVLMAEDDGLNAAMLRTILEQLGHQVVHAQNGRRAVDLAAAVAFDLVMLDGRMPQMDAPRGDPRHPQAARAGRGRRRSSR